MNQKAALFVDVSNLYYYVGRRFDNRKLDYQKLLNLARQLAPIQRAFAYGAQVKAEASAFITCLKKIGYETRYKEPRTDEMDGRPIRRTDWEVGIAIDVVRIVDRVEVIVLASSNPTFLPLLQWIKEQIHCRVILIGCGLGREFREGADEWHEITEELLEVNGIAAA